MKSIINSSTILKCTALVLLLSYSLNLTTKLKKSETVMEFFNNLFLENKSKNTNQNNFSTRIKLEPPAVSPSSPDPTAPSSNSTVTNDILGDWLQVSSKVFKNVNKFPSIILPDGSSIKIKTDLQNFRINDAFTFTGLSPDGPVDDKYFWFRLSGSHLYYSNSKTDMNLMGAIAISDIKDTKDDKDPTRYCLSVTDTERIKWILCASNEDTKIRFSCLIRKSLGKSITDCELQQLKANVTIASTVIEETTIQPIILIPLPSRKCNEGWTYASAGSDWECACADGQEQSPIDLPDPIKAMASPITPLFQYEEVEAKSPITSLDGQVMSEQYIKIRYFQNALRIFHPNMGKIVTLDGAVYVAEEIVFHTPSEHTLNGKRYDMEMQVIHYGQSQGDISKQVILSFMFERKPGVYNKFMDDVDFFSLPNSMYKERDITNNLFIPKVLYSSDDNSIPILIPFSFFTYQGSITFPPCTERTIHYVASDAIPIGGAPLELMKEALRTPDSHDEKGNLYVSDEKLENFRQQQPLNDRIVFHFDHRKYCGPEGTKKVHIRPEGHYETVPKKVTEYYYVHGNEPSGLPGSFVVDESEAKGDNLVQ